MPIAASEAAKLAAAENEFAASLVYGMGVAPICRSSRTIRRRPLACDQRADPATPPSATDDPHAAKLRRSGTNHGPDAGPLQPARRGLPRGDRPARR
ncbi:hypothetical protein ACCAA_810040 [Candidatus Accumulibacter aalborgensis]|uniref:Uncharacterized protein n=1 Tax=Candidatus Accumulibacter aalborgensis TaxID=1860102 RepID=A0A1A8XYH4_9PROT|nr:hypothetical protein ACCAA_810040 [Candidatus Accumulibacter aalborgensis]